MNKNIKLRIIDKLSSLQIISDYYKVELKEVKRSYRSQFLFNALFRNIVLFYVLYILMKLKLIKVGAKLGLFYGMVRKKKYLIEKEIQYKDIITGEEKTDTIDGLFDKSNELAEINISAVNNYFMGRIEMRELKNIISGQSLLTGKISTPISNAKFFAS